MTARIAVYRALSRIIRQFDREQIPLHGIVGNEWALPAADNTTHLQAAFRRNCAASTIQAQQLDVGFSALRRLQEQLDVLEGAEEHSRQAMACWHQLRSIIDTRTEAAERPYAAVERGSHLLQQLARASSPSLDAVVSEEVSNDAAQPSLETDAVTAKELDSLAAAVRDSASSEIFPSECNAPANQQISNGSLRKMQLGHMSKVLFEEHRFRQMPFEWVYDGLSPALLSDVLASKKGLSIVLASIYLLTAHRLGIPLVMLPAHSDTASGANLLTPPGLAISASPPMPSKWMLYSPGFSGTSTLSVDPLQKGQVICAEAHLAEQDINSFHFRVWAEQARIMVIAHQRRGESDAVANWIYQLLSLDPTATEWSEALGLS